MAKKRGKHGKRMLITQNRVHGVSRTMRAMRQKYRSPTIHLTEDWFDPAVSLCGIDLYENVGYSHAVLVYVCEKCLLAEKFTRTER